MPCLWGSCENGIRRRRYNFKLREYHENKEPNVVKMIKIRKLKCLCNADGINDTNPAIYKDWASGKKISRKEIKCVCPIMDDLSDLRVRNWKFRTKNLNNWIDLLEGTEYYQYRLPILQGILIRLICFDSATVWIVK